MQQLGAASQPQLGAASQPQLGAGAAAQQGAGAGAGAQQGAGAGAGAQQGAGASQHGAGAGSQQLDFIECSLESNPLRMCLRAGLQHGSGSQLGAGSQHGAGAGSQHGAGSQQELFLWKRPAEADEEKLTATATTATDAIKRRMDLSPKFKNMVSFHAPNTLWLPDHPGLHPAANLVDGVDANSTSRDSS